VPTLHRSLSGAQLVILPANVLTSRIPRAEVEDIAAIIGKELQEIEPRCVWEICGGYGCAFTALLSACLTSVRLKVSPWKSGEQ